MNVFWWMVLAVTCISLAFVVVPPVADYIQSGPIIAEWHTVNVDGQKECIPYACKIVFNMHWCQQGDDGYYNNFAVPTEIFNESEWCMKYNQT